MNKFVLPLGAIILIAAAASSLIGLSQGCETGECPDIVVITSESIRPDHMPCYGYERNTTPYICGLAEDSHVYHNAYSPSSHTELALPAIESGMYPFEIGVYGGEISYIDQDVVMASEVLSEAGYYTMWLYTGTDLRQKEANFFQGVDIMIARDNYSSTGEVVSKIKNMRENRSEYVRIHLSGPTPPYNVKQKLTPEYRLRYLENDTSFFNRSNVSRRKEMGQDELVNRYDESLRWVDYSQFRPVVSALKKEGVYNSSVVVFTADHGEALGENGAYGHSTIPANSVLEVPLLLKLPGQEKRIDYDEQVSSIDILPTLADFIGVKPISDFTGRTLLEPESRPILIQDMYRGIVYQGKLLFRQDGDWRSNINVSEGRISSLKRQIDSRFREGAIHVTLDEKGHNCKDIEPYFTCEN